MTIADYEKRLASQGGKCANPGCRNDGKAFHVDHDHSCCPRKYNTCGKCVRGILCSTCNQALGNLGDDMDKISGLLDYLKPRTFESGVSQGLL